MRRFGGESSQVTWGAANDLPTLHSAVYNVVSHPFCCPFILPSMPS